MFSRSASGSAICLGCRLQLLRRSPHPIASRSRSQLFDRTSTPSSRWLASESTARSDEPEDRHPHAKNESSATHEEAHDVDHPHDGASFPPSQPNRSGPYKTKHIRARTRHISRNRILTETSEDLHTSMLGNQARVIVMRDDGLYKRHRPVFQDQPQADQETALDDIEKLLDDQKAKPTDDEVRVNIHQMRPQSETPMTAEEFAKLQEALTNGFLKHQLRDYFVHFQDEKKGLRIKEEQDSFRRTLFDKPKPSESVSDFDWIESLESWVPLAVDNNLDESVELDQGVERDLQGYTQPSASEKGKIAVKIMRVCWNLSIAPLLTGIGETQIQVRDQEFALLMRGSQRFLRDLNKRHIDAGERIEAIRSKRTLRLVTTKSKAQSILRDLNDILSHVHTKTVPINWVAGDQDVAEEVLEEVGRLTGTHIRRSQNGKRIHITWVDSKRLTKASPDSRYTEDKRQIVFRFLMTALSPPEAVKRLLGPSPSEFDDPQCQFVVDQFTKGSRAWKDRLSQWARLVTPVSREAAGDVTADPLTNLDIPLELAKANEPTSERGASWLDGKRQSRLSWGPETSLSTKVTFGHVLHPYAGPGEEGIPISSLLDAGSRHPRIFSAATPHPRQLPNLTSAAFASQALSPSGAGDAKHPLAPASTLLLRFVPANAYLSQGPPDLELRLRATDFRIEGVDSLHAIAPGTTHVTDVIQPAGRVDVRIAQHRYTPLLGRERGGLAAWPPIAEYVKGAHLDLAGGRLEVMPTQRFLVPRRLMTTPSSTKEAKTTKTKTTPEEPPIADGVDGAAVAAPTTTEEAEAAASDASNAAAADHLESVNYQFAGLELRRSVSVPYRGFKLTYTSIEAGKMGGRRAELTLEPEIPPVGSGGSSSGSWAKEADLSLAYGDVGPATLEALRNGPAAVEPAELEQDFLAAVFRLAKTSEVWTGGFVEGAGA